jgi:hypothetical protein
MGATVYVLGTLTSLACAILLLRGYANSRKRLLLWSGICFAILAVSNLLVFMDLILLPEIDLYRYRLASAAIAMAVLLYGLIWESDR